MKRLFSFEKLWDYCSFRNILISLLVVNLFCNNCNMQAQSSVEKSITYIHQEKPSMSARNVKSMARFFVPKNSIAKKLEKENFVSEASPIPKKYLKEFQVDIYQVNCRNVYKFSPKENKSEKCVLYLHGGAYINNIFAGHWDFIAQLVRSNSCTVVIPDYPLAPASTYLDAFAMLNEIYKMLLTETDSENIIFMGDSAGGGFALAFSESLGVAGMSQPSQIILISPWLDVSMSNPEIEVIQKKDPILSARTLILAGKAWAGNTDTKSYLVSPVYGNLKGLPKISIFIGTDDVLYPDCKKLKIMLDQQNIPLNYFEYPKMFHVWVLFTFLKEAKIAGKQINELI
jgi:acetyl esterase/lipase